MYVWSNICPGDTMEEKDVQVLAQLSVVCDLNLFVKEITRSITAGCSPTFSAISQAMFANTLKSLLKASLKFSLSDKNNHCVLL